MQNPVKPKHEFTHIHHPHSLHSGIFLQNRWMSWTLPCHTCLFFFSFFPKYHPGVLRDHLSSSCRLQADYNRHRHLLFITISSTEPKHFNNQCHSIATQRREHTLHQRGEKKKHACIFQKLKSRGVEGTAKRSKKSCWGVMMEEPASLVSSNIMYKRGATRTTFCWNEQLHVLKHSSLV